MTFPRAFGALVQLAPLVFLAHGCTSEEAPLDGTLDDVHVLANRCVVLAVDSPAGPRYLAPTTDGTAYAFDAADAEAGARLLARPADLGVYVFRDASGGYPIDDGGPLARTTSVESDITRHDIGYVSGALWSATEAVGGITLENLRTGRHLTRTGFSEREASAVRVVPLPATGCAPFPELSVDAQGSVVKTHFDDGTLFGFADAHSHLFMHEAFGGGGTFHGAIFHPLGVEHALPDCTNVHGEGGIRDIVGYFFGNGVFDVDAATNALLSGELSTADHATDGYPTFSDWPNVHTSTHQMQYYRWVERAYLGGMRLVVAHMTGNQVLCELVSGVLSQDPRFSCNEMVSVERSIDDAYALERYVDAQHGGPGLGWFRVVTSPAAAREVIADGKLAVVLGIETSNVLDCFANARDGFPACDEATMLARLDHVHDRGVRVMFPVHKFDNGFTAGDGHRGVIEFGNFLNSGHYSNYTTDCPPNPGAVFDGGNVVFGGINMPRAVYDAPAPLDRSLFVESPVDFLFPFRDTLGDPPLVGAYCQSAGLTPLGEQLISAMMQRGMVVEIDHLPQRSYARALEMLTAADYPPAATHGSTGNGQVFALQGISTSGLPRCTPSNPAGLAAGILGRADAAAAAGGYRAVPFGFDMNGFAGAHGPRFGASGCGGAEANPITYPFSSYAGDVTFEAPHVGTRAVDFNEEGMVHIGLAPELIEDARRMGFSDAELEPIFRSAEGYIRMWERAEARGRALQGN